MAKINGTLVLVNLGGTALAHVDNCTLNTELELAESTDKDSGGFREYLENAGLRGGTIDVSGNADFAAAAGNAKQLADYLLARSNVSFIFGPTAAGSLQVTGNALTNNLSIEAPNEQTATLSGSLTINGSFATGTAS